MATIPEQLRYTRQHEWVRLEGDEATFGITDYAQSELGDITYVELPEVGRAVRQFEELCAVESVKAASDIYAPLSGEVIDVNGDLDEGPERINESPYGEGWICRVRASNATVETKALMDAAAYARHVEECQS